MASETGLVAGGEAEGVDVTEVSDRTSNGSAPAGTDASTEVRPRLPRRASFVRGRASGEESGRGWLRSLVGRPSPRRLALAAAGALAGAAIVAAALLIVSRLDAGEQKVREELRVAAVDTGRVARAGGRARTLAAVVAVGERSAPVLRRLDASRRRLAAVGDRSLRAPAVAVLSAERDLLAAYARLAELSPQRLGAWAGIKRDMSSARRALVRAQPALDRLELGPGTVPAQAGLEQAERALDRTVSSAERKLSAWRRRYRAAERRQRAELRRLDGYGAAMGAQLSGYAGLRSELDRWLDEFGSERVPFGRAEQYLSDALSQRQQLLNAIAALTPPAAVAASHVALQGILEQALRAMDNAIDGARECSQDPFCYGDDFRDTPDWREFMRGSADINARIGSLQAQWEHALAAATDSVKQRRLPAPPRV